MQYYMLDKNDISVVRGIVSSKDVMRELGITNAQFHKMLRNEETYKGCILLPIEIALLFSTVKSGNSAIAKGLAE